MSKTSQAKTSYSNLGYEEGLSNLPKRHFKKKSLKSKAYLKAYNRGKRERQRIRRTMLEDGGAQDL